MLPFPHNRDPDFVLVLPAIRALEKPVSSDSLILILTAVQEN
jgi:hypothetical protein